MLASRGGRRPVKSPASRPRSRGRPEARSRSSPPPRARRPCLPAAQDRRRAKTLGGLQGLLRLGLNLLGLLESARDPLDADLRPLEFDARRLLRDTPLANFAGQACDPVLQGVDSLGLVGEFVFVDAPEPGTMLLLVSGAAGLILIGRNRMRR